MVIFFRCRSTFCFILYLLKPIQPYFTKTNIVKKLQNLLYCEKSTFNLFLQCEIQKRMHNNE